MTIEIRSEPPAALSINTERRTYTSYQEEVDALIANAGQWGLLKTIPFPLAEVSEDVPEAERVAVATKLARKRAGYFRAMVLSRKGTFAGSRWKVLMAQPNGPGTALELWISYDGPAAPAAEGAAGASAEAASTEGATDAAQGAEGDVKPRARRGAAVSA